MTGFSCRPAEIKVCVSHTLSPQAGMPGQHIGSHASFRIQEARLRKPAVPLHAHQQRAGEAALFCHLSPCCPLAAPHSSFFSLGALTLSPSLLASVSTSSLVEEFASTRLSPCLFSFHFILAALVLGIFWICSPHSKGQVQKFSLESGLGVVLPTLLAERPQISANASFQDT